MRTCILFLWKWHLGASDDPPGPGDLAVDHAGYDSYRVTYHKDFPETGPNYYTFTYTKDDPLGPQKVEVDVSEQKYLTHETAQWVLDWWASAAAQGPWFAYVPFFAAHHPRQCPPTDIYPWSVCTNNPTQEDQHRQMIRALDEEIGRLLAAVPPNTLIIFAGDNGSQGDIALDPVEQNKAKATVLQGGVRVPLLIFGQGVDPSVLGSTIDYPVSLSDLYDTILEIAGETNPGSGRTPAQDKHSVSLVPYLTDPNAVAQRDCLYTEMFQPNGVFGGPTGASSSFSLYNLAVRDDRYKYMLRMASGAEMLFDLAVDPWEDDNLLLQEVPPEAIKYDLQACGDEFFETCTLRKDTGEDCEDDAECCSDSCTGSLCD